MTVWSTSHISAWSELTVILTCRLSFHPILKMTVLFAARCLQITFACILIASSNINCHHQTLAMFSRCPFFVSPTPVAEDITDCKPSVSHTISQESLLNPGSHHFSLPSCYHLMICLHCLLLSPPQLWPPTESPVSPQAPQSLQHGNNWD